MSIGELATYLEIEYEDLEFEEEIGAGTYGSVYRATWKSRKKTVAVKQMNSLGNEPQLLSRLCHKNIIHFYGAVTKMPNYCLVTDFASGGSLYDLLHGQEDLSVHSVLFFSLDIASGMHYLHCESDFNILHRDLKSKNVVLQGNVCKLCDFGDARHFMNTAPMTLAGTYPWMAPEVIRGDDVGAASDVWSFGVILWELLSREVPYRHLTPQQIMYLVGNDYMTLPIPSSCPPQFKDLMSSCWAKDKNERPAFKSILCSLELLREQEIHPALEEFQGNKQSWVVEIHRHLEECAKQPDRSEELREWENRLKEQELRLQATEPPRRNLADVTEWTEDDVATWLSGLKLQGSTIAQAKEVFKTNRITGGRLFVLSDVDLVALGISIQFERHKLLAAIQDLKYQRHLATHFPPLEKPSPKQNKQSSETQSSAIELVFIYGVHVKPHTDLKKVKWKAFCDVDYKEEGANGVKADYYIRDIQLKVVRSTYTIPRSPFVSSDFITGYPSDKKITFVVNFKDSVLQPRSHKLLYKLDTADPRPANQSVTLTVDNLEEPVTSTPLQSPQLLQGAWSHKHSQPASPVPFRPPPFQRSPTCPVLFSDQTPPVFIPSSPSDGLVGLLAQQSGSSVKGLAPPGPTFPPSPYYVPPAMRKSSNPLKINIGSSGSNTPSGKSTSRESPHQGASPSPSPALSRASSISGRRNLFEEFTPPSDRENSAFAFTSGGSGVAARGGRRLETSGGGGATPGRSISDNPSPSQKQVQPKRQSSERPSYASRFTNVVQPRSSDLSGFEVVPDLFAAAAAAAAVGTAVWVPRMPVPSAQASLNTAGTRGRQQSQPKPSVPAGAVRNQEAFQKNAVGDQAQSSNAIRGDKDLPEAAAAIPRKAPTQGSNQWQKVESKKKSKRKTQQKPGKKGGKKT